MSTTNEKTKRNRWVLPGLIVWAFAPAILIASSILGGWNSGELGIISPGRQYENQGGIGEAALVVGLFGMPIILYAWSVFVLRRYGVKKEPKAVKAALIGIPLSIVMCVANLAVGFTGCSVLTKVIPNEGIF